MRKLIAGSAIAAAFASLGVAYAQDGYLPVDGGYEMVPAASKLAEEVHFFHNSVLLPIITVISIFVLALLLYVIVRYNSKANPTPRKVQPQHARRDHLDRRPGLILLTIPHSFPSTYSSRKM
ncbi:MAG: cytochrome c oxidase subunit II transmembrane domain-containing protein [Parvularculaceae bacterium]